MILPTSDGSKAKAIFLQSGPDGERTERTALAAMNSAIKMVLYLAMDGMPADIEAKITANVNKHLDVVVSTSLDCAATAYGSVPQAAHAPIAPPHSAPAVAAATVAGLAAGASVGQVRHDLYRAGSLLGDAEAVASGNPETISRRAGQHIFWRAFGKLGRGIFRGIGGKR